MDENTGAESPTPSPVLAGRYELGPVLGRGGMATVRDATDRRLGRRVAVKILRADLAEQRRARERFETEAHAAARLTHPNVVTVFDSGEDDDIPFLVMERLSGRTFADELSEGSVPVGRVRDVAGEILAALTAAHAAGIIHRDIKPGNVLLTDDGHAKVSDFGIAKTLDDSDQTQTAEVLATPGYLAPERLGGRPASEQSDLYSVGVLLYEAIAGCRPFSGDTHLALMRAIEQGEATPLTSLRPALPPEIVAVVERSMCVDPNERFHSAAEMAAALEPATDLDATVAVSVAAGAGVAAASEAPTVAVPQPVRAGDLEPRDGSTRVLPVPAPAPPAAAAATAAPVASGGGPGSRRMWNRVLAVGLMAGLAAAVIGVVASGGDPARPTVPATSTSTSPTSLTRVTSPNPTTPTTPTTRAPVVKPAAKNQHGKDRHGDSNGNSGD
ncbi:MAG: eukaryotic-like serine/threonine-protein kinase [Actinomycetota bacterium]|nr:eukaryotic-like serine/threonine-protein kinase [Actinomycetota bacterium]